LNPDGSEDHELKIKGLDNIAVGDYSRVGPEEKNGFGSLTATDIAAVESAQVKLAAQVAKAKEKLKAKRARKDAEEESGSEESGSNNEQHEEVFTLGRMNTRSQTRVSRYFTNAEVEADTEEQEEKEAGGRIYIDSDESDIDEEPEFDPSDDEDFNEGRQGDEDVADENM
jgi:hypothetical protein